MGLMSMTAMAATTTTTKIDLSYSDDTNAFGDDGEYVWDADTKILYLKSYSADVNFILPAGSTVLVSGTSTVAWITCNNSSATDVLTFQAEKDGAVLNVVGGTDTYSGSVWDMSGNIAGLNGSITIKTGLTVKAYGISTSTDYSTLTIEAGATVNLTNSVSIGASGSSNGRVVVDGTLNVEGSDGVGTEIMTIGSTGSVTITGATNGIKLMGDEAKLTVEEGGALSIESTDTALQVVRDKLDEQSDLTAEECIVLPDRYLAKGLELCTVTYNDTEDGNYSYGYTIATADAVEDVWYNSSYTPPVEGGATNISIAPSNAIQQTTLSIADIEDTTYGNDVELIAYVVDEDGAAVDGGAVTFVCGEQKFTAEVVEGKAVYTLQSPAIGSYEVSGYYTSENEMLYEDCKAEEAVTFEVTEAVVVAYTVSFDGVAVYTDVEHGSTVEAPENPTLDGYTFVGWYNGTEAYDFTTPVVSDLALTSQWEAIEVDAEVENDTDDETTEDDTVTDDESETESSDEVATGDHEPIMIWTVLLILSVIGVAGAYIYTSKKKK